MNRETERAVATESSGNVFKDLRFTNADELQARAELTRQIRNILQRRQLSQRAAVQLLELAQPDVARLVKGRYTGFSLDRPMTLVRRLD
jgi:predicted XRE-type DNA-binding protein